MNEQQQPPAQLVALGFDGSSVPTVLAKGSGALAEQLLAEAERLGLFIHRDESLVKFLNQLQLGEQIPRELYLLVAELIAFSYLLQGKMPARWKDDKGQTHHRV